MLPGVHVAKVQSPSMEGRVTKQCMAADSHLILTLGCELGVIDLGVTEPLASVGGCIELRLAVPYDV